MVYVGINHSTNCHSRVNFVLFFSRDLVFKMEEEKKFRLRAPNYTEGDNTLLCDIVSKYKHILENRDTDGVTLIQKRKVWVEVAREFNATTSGYSRNSASLQQSYKNLKAKAKKKVSNAKMKIPVNKTTLIQSIEEHGTSSKGWDEVAKSVGASKGSCQETFSALHKEADTKEKKFKNNVMGTGGGPPPKFEDDPLLEKVAVLVGPAMDGMFTIYDGDSSLMASQHVMPIETRNMDAGEEREVPYQSIEVEYDPDTSLLIQDEHRDDEAKNMAETLDSEEPFFSNDRANLKKKPHTLLSRKKKLAMQVPIKQTVSEKFKLLASEKMELVKLQKDVLRTQLQDEKEKLEHNRLLRSMEMENAKKNHEHNEIIRKLEIENFVKENK